MLALLDELLEAKGGEWWDAFFADRSRDVPFFGQAPDENLIEWSEESLLGTGRALELGCGNGRDPV